MISEKVHREQDVEGARESHGLLDGERRAIDEPYSNGEMYCGQIDINCRGWDEFVVDFGALEACAASEGDPVSSGDDQDDDARYDDGDERGPAGGGSGDDDRHAEVDDLIREIVENPERQVTDEEINRIVDRVAGASFDSRHLRVPPQLRDVSYMGLRLGEKNHSLLRHLAQRVVVDRQWAEGTTATEYVKDLRAAVCDPSARIGVGAPEGSPPLVYVVSEMQVPEKRRGENNERLMFVLYGTAPGVIITGYQASSMDAINFPENVRWLR